MDTQEVHVKTEPDFSSVVLHSISSGELEQQNERLNDSCSASLACGTDASVPTPTVLANDIKAVAASHSPNGQENKPFLFSDGDSDISIPQYGHGLQPEIVGVAMATESAFQIDGSGVSIKLEPCYAVLAADVLDAVSNFNTLHHATASESAGGTEQTADGGNQASDVGFVKFEENTDNLSSAGVIKSEDDSAVPTGLYKNVYIKPEPSVDNLSSVNADCIADYAEQPRMRRRTRRSCINIASVSTSREDLVLADAYPKVQIMKECSIRLQRLPDGMMSKGVFRVPRNQVVAPTQENMDVVFVAGPGDVKFKVVVPKDTAQQIQNTEQQQPHSPMNASSEVKRNVILTPRSSKGPRPYKCNQCGKTYKTASGCSQHKKVHIGRKDHACKVCGKLFMYKSSMTSHMRIHTNIRPYPCPICGKAFRCSSHLKLHIGRHTSERHFPCDICGKAFKLEAGLQAHMRLHKDFKPHKCDKCDWAFRSYCNLKQHQRRHTGERPYKCNLCTAAFAHRNSLVIHIRTHTGEKPFKCKICASRFSQATHLRIHMKVHNDPKRALRYKRRKQKAELLLAKGIKLKPKPRRAPVNSQSKPQTLGEAKPNGNISADKKQKKRRAVEKDSHAGNSKQTANTHNSDSSQSSGCKTVVSKPDSAVDSNSRPQSVKSPPPSTATKQTGKQPPFKRKGSLQPHCTSSATSITGLPSATAPPSDPQSGISESTLPNSVKETIPSKPENLTNQVPPTKVKKDLQSGAKSTVGSAPPGLDSLSHRVMMYRPLLFQSVQRKKTGQNDTTKTPAASGDTSKKLKNTPP